MKWRVQFKTADGLECNEVIELGNRYPYPEYKRPVKRALKFILQEEPFKIEPTPVRTYRLLERNFGKFYCIYEEVVN